VLVRYTYAGDANLDGVVNSGDFSALATSFNSTSGIWGIGDFNYDGVVNALDFNLLAVNYGLPTLPAPEPGAALGALVPEPSGALLALGGLTCVIRRRRRK
jgi:hypothetical protein